MKKILSAILVLAVLVSSFCITSVLADDGNDISYMLSGINVNLKAGNMVIKDNAVVGDLVSYSNMTLTIDWKMDETVFAGAANAGDYFNIELPRDLFSITTVNRLDLSDNGLVLGTWEISADQPIHFVLNEEGANKLSLEGSFTFYGSARKYTETSATITIADQVYDIVTVPYVAPVRPDEGFTYGNGTSWKASSIFSKGGYQAGAGKNQIRWALSTNYANHSKMLAGEPYDELENAWVEDNLEADQTLEKLTIVSAIKYPHPDGTLDSKDAATIDFTSQFPKIENDMGLSDDEFMEYMKAYDAPAYGVSSDLKRVVVSFGDLSGNGVKYGKDDADFLANTIRWAPLNSYEKDAVIDIYGEKSVVSGQVLGYTVILITNVTGAQKTYSNTASFGYGSTGEVHESTQKNVPVTYVSGTISGVDPNAVRLIKKDAVTDELLEDATFKIQKKNAGGSYEDYTPPSGIAQLTTNSNGELEFKNLPAGEYRFIEVSAADGYDADSVIYSATSFTIVSGDPGALITATNEKTKAPTPPPVTAYKLGWMRSSELPAESFLKPVGIYGDAWTYSEAFRRTPIKYFEDEAVRAVANEKVANGTEYTSSEEEQLVGMSHIWDHGTYFSKYKNENGNVPFGWASWEHFGESGTVEDKGEYSIRRFSAYIDFSADDLASTSSIMLAPEDELGNMSYLFPLNDNVFVFVNGQLAFWGGTDVAEGANQYGALNRTEFMGKVGIKVRNGVNGVFKDVYPHTDGWCIDLVDNADAVDIKSLLVPGFNRIDVIADEYWEGGGMNQLSVYAKN